LWSLGILLSAFAHCSLAETLVPAAGNSEATGGDESAETLPSYKGEGSIYLGFRWVEFDEFSRPAEYEEDSSLVVGINGIACPLPNRYHLQGEYLGKNSYYSDLGYAYRDIVLFRDLLVGVHHNLYHYNYLLPGDPPFVTYEDRNPGDKNYVNFTKNDLSLRLKAPDFPMHAFLKHRYVERDGSIQERFVLGDFFGLTKVSESRDIDWQSNDLTFGMNSHLGPVEIEYAYNQEEFEPGSNNVLYDWYPASDIFGRPGDIYPHNGVTETESTANSLKFHTSFTGQLVASATLSNAGNTNNYSGAESEAWKAAVDLRWLPDPLIGVFLRYRHKTLDQQNPDTTTLFGQNNRLNYRVRDLVSSHNDLASISARYRPLNAVTLIGNYEFEHRHRTDLEDWEMLPENSDVHRVNLTVHASPLDALKLKAIYDYENYQDPSYNTEPDHLNKFRLNAVYTPAAWVTAYLDYSLAVTRRDDLHYTDDEFENRLGSGQRDGHTDRFLGSLSLLISPESTFTASWSYSKWDVDQDLAFTQWDEGGGGEFSLYYAFGNGYVDESNTISLSLYYQLRQDLSLTTDLSYTIAKGDFTPGNYIMEELSNPPSFSSVKTTETILTIDLAKQLLENWEVGIRFVADFFDDDFSEKSSDHQDGNLFITTFMVKRYF